MINISNTYPDLPLTNYPEQIDVPNKYRDPSLSEMPLIQQYYEHINSGDYAAANQILENNPSLRECFISADRLNAAIEANVALQRFFRDNVFEYIVNAIKPKGVWSETTQYYAFDLVNYEMVKSETGFYYDSAIVIKDNPPIGTPPTNDEYFIPITLRGARGASGVGLSFRQNWNAEDTYNIDDIVRYDNSLWISVYENTGKSPKENPEWQLFYEFEHSFYKPVAGTKYIVTYPDGSVKTELRRTASNLLIAEMIITYPPGGNIVQDEIVYGQDGVIPIGHLRTITKYLENGNIEKEVKTIL